MHLHSNPETVGLRSEDRDRANPSKRHGGHLLQLHSRVCIQLSYLIDWHSGTKKVIWHDETMVDYLLLAGVELFTESNAEFLAETLEGLEVLLVLVLGLDLGLDTYSDEGCEFMTVSQSHAKCRGRDGGKRTLEDADSGGEVVDAASGPESGGEDLNGRDEIVGEAVVQVALES